jgi:3-methyladenine DNA glycosylase AlkD
MKDADARVREVSERLEGLARPASAHPASGGYGSRLRRLGLRTPEVRVVARDLALDCRGLPPREVVRAAQGLVDGGSFEGGLVAFELLWRHHAAAATLTARDLARLAGGADNWVTTDTFACLVSGPAWHRGRVSDAWNARWARSRDRWLRRIALVSTVPLNLPSRGGAGDVPRTLRVCRMLVADHDDMIVKALSWALREAAKRDPAAVRRFLERHRSVLAARVVREVTNKLVTGLKTPKRGRAASARRAPRAGGGSRQGAAR